MTQANPVFPRAEEDNLVYVAAPSVGHAIGIMVAVIISMLLGTSCILNLFRSRFLRILDPDNTDDASY